MAISSTVSAGSGFNTRMAPRVGSGHFPHNADSDPSPMIWNSRDEPFCRGHAKSAYLGTGEPIRLLGPIETLDRKIEREAPQIPEIVSAYDNRIRILKEQANLEGYSLNHASEAGFLEFFRKNPFIRRGYLVLLENGNLRAVWKGENEAHVGLQFLNQQTVQYVIFARRGPSCPISRVSGRDTIDGVRKQIEAFDLVDVLYA